MRFKSYLEENYAPDPNEDPHKRGQANPLIFISKNRVAPKGPVKRGEVVYVRQGKSTRMQFMVDTLLRTGNFKRGQAIKNSKMNDVWVPMIAQKNVSKKEIMDLAEQGRKAFEPLFMLKD